MSRCPMCTTTRLRSATFFAAAVCAPSACLCDILPRIPSPNGRIEFKMKRVGSRLGFTVLLQGRPVIEQSPLGFSVDGVELAESETVRNVEWFHANETYSTRGIHSRAVNSYRGIRFPLRHSRGPSVASMEIRIFDDRIVVGVVIVHCSHRHSERSRGEAIARNRIELSSTELCNRFAPTSTKRATCSSHLLHRVHRRVIPAE